MAILSEEGVIPEEPFNRKKALALLRAEAEDANMDKTHTFLDLSRSRISKTPMTMTIMSPWMQRTVSISTASRTLY